MKQNKIFKKLSAIIMTFAMLFGILGMTGGTLTAKASSTPVKMYKLDYTFNKYGISQYYVYIQVDAGSAANKAVYVHHDSYENGWVDTAATYLTKLDDNTEIWKAYISGAQTEEFAVKYVGDGQTYWDNNNGNNYTVSNVLGAANVAAIRLHASKGSSAANYYISAAVKNLAYNKTVKVRYTQDNWATYQDADLSYECATSVTDQELWSTTLNLDSSKMDSFQYCISYEVNGQTYWDNNFGENFDTNYYRAY